MFTSQHKDVLCFPWSLPLMYLFIHIIKMIYYKNLFYQINLLLYLYHTTNIIIYVLHTFTIVYPTSSRIRYALYSIIVYFHSILLYLGFGWRFYCFIFNFDNSVLPLWNLLLVNLTFVVFIFSLVFDMLRLSFSYCIIFWI